MREKALEISKQPDFTQPSLERQTELRDIYEGNVSAGNPPYADVRIKTFGELQWIFAERGWLGENNPRYENEFANLQEVYFVGTNLRGIHLASANLTNARFLDTDVSNALLFGVNLSNAIIINTDLSGTNLRSASFNVETFMANVSLFSKEHGGVWLGDIRWEGIDLTKVDWSHLLRLGDERDMNRRSKVEEYRTVARAYRQLATQLRNQGISEDADRFAYRAQLWQRRVLLRTWRLPQYLFSLLLDVLAGYGYHPERSFSGISRRCLGLRWLICILASITGTRFILMRR